MKTGKNLNIVSIYTTITKFGVIFWNKSLMFDTEKQ